jgi:hypothetical protein
VVTAHTLATTMARATCGGIRPHYQCGTATSAAATCPSVTAGNCLMGPRFGSAQPVIRQWCRLISGPTSCSTALSTLPIPINGVSHGRSTLRGIAQASCDGFADYVDASAHGWKTFLVKPAHIEAPAGTVHCQASIEAGQKTTCALCTLCDGDRRHVVINAHGAKASKVAFVA